jgi:ureidoacrylate peracid hydrolase
MGEERLLTSMEELVKPEHTGLVIVDMQNDFCHKEGFFGKGMLDKRGYGQQPADLSLIEEATPNILRLANAARASKVKVYFVISYMNDHYLPPMMRLRNFRIGRTAQMVPEGAWGSEPFDGLLPTPEDTVIIKHSYSAFLGTNFNDVLSKARIKTLIVTGVATNVCCETTIRDGCCLGFYIIVPRDCVCTYNRDDHTRALHGIENFYGVVATSQEIMTCWDSASG